MVLGDPERIETGIVGDASLAQHVLVQLAMGVRRVRRPLGAVHADAEAHLNQALNLRIDTAYASEAAIAGARTSVIDASAKGIPRRSATAPATNAPTLPMPRPTPIMRLDAMPTKAGSSRCASAVTCASEAKNRIPATNIQGTSKEAGNHGTGSSASMPVTSEAVTTRELP